MTSTTNNYINGHSSSVSPNMNSVQANTSTVAGSKISYYFNSLNVVVPTSGKTSKTILNGLSGKFTSNKLTAILGPSGSGKTTLLNVLAHRRKGGVTGHLQVVDQTTVKKSRISYITQDFTLLSHLTVEETLEYAIDFRWQSIASKIAKRKTEKNLIQTLHLENCAKTFVHKLSGGECKRLSIGIELVSDPAIMLIDEPSSGLDSVSAFQVISHLKDLVQHDRLIVCALHQPSSNLLALFDEIFVISQGNCLYSGCLERFVPTLASFGFECPEFYNRADFALEVASRDLNELNGLIENSKNSTLSTLPPRIIDKNENEGKILIEEEAFPMIQRNGHTWQNISHSYPISQWRQFCILVKRSLLCTRRNFLFAQLRVISHFFVGLLLGTVFYGMGNESSKILTNASCLYFFLLFIYFGNAMPSVLAIPQETAVFLREHSNHWYSLFAYFLSKIVADIPLQLSGPTLFLVAGYYLTGQPLEWNRFAMLWVILLLTTILAHMLGMVAGAASDAQIGVFIVPVTSIPMLVFSGFFARQSDVFEWLGPLFRISYFRHAYHGALKSVYGYERTNMTCSEIFCYYRKPTQFLADMNVGTNAIHFEIDALVGWIVALQILFYVILRIKLKFAKN